MAQSRRTCPKHAQFLARPSHLWVRTQGIDGSLSVKFPERSLGKKRATKARVFQGS